MSILEAGARRNRQGAPAGDSTREHWSEQPVFRNRRPGDVMVPMRSEPRSMTARPMSRIGRVRRPRRCLERSARRFSGDIGLGLRSSRHGARLEQAARVEGWRIGAPLSQRRFANVA